MALPRVPPPPAPPRPPRAWPSGLPPWVLPVALVIALVAAFLLGTLAYIQRQEVERLRAELADAEARIAELEAELARDSGSGLENLLDELLDALLDGLGGGSLEDLLGGAGAPDVSRCLAGEGLGGQWGGGEPIRADDVATQVAGIAERVESQRGLAFREAVGPQILPTGEFAALTRQLVLEGYSAQDAELDRRVLAALGAVGPGVDLRAVVVDLVGEQAAGFYRPETGELVVRADDPAAPLDPAEQVVLAHELQHAAADQNLGLPVGHHEAVERDDDARAALALVEGDATVFMQQFALGALELTDQLAMAMDPSVTDSQQQIAGYPEYLQREMLFPYLEGMAFACGLYADGGWEAVDAAYAEPPATTAHVLWPERYAAREAAVDVAGLGAPGGFWSERRTTTFGAAELLWLFSAPGDDPAAALDDPRGRAAAWAGGKLRLWTKGADSAVGVALAQRPGEADLCASVMEWYDAAFPDAHTVTTAGDEALAASGPHQSAVVACTGDSVRVGIAPDLPTARQVVG